MPGEEGGGRGGCLGAAAGRVHGRLVQNSCSGVSSPHIIPAGAEGQSPLPTGSGTGSLSPTKWGGGRHKLFLGTLRSKARAGGQLSDMHLKLRET